MYLKETESVCWSIKSVHVFQDKADIFMVQRGASFKFYGL